jgi:hypothetical protein
VLTVAVGLRVAHLGSLRKPLDGFLTKQGYGIIDLVVLVDKSFEDTAYTQ